MSIKQVTMYTLECENCGRISTDGSEYGGFTDVHGAEQDAQEIGWHIEDGKHYCYDCHGFDQDDNFYVLIENERQIIHEA